MVTKPRQFNVNLPYHIYNRGVEKRDIFTCPRDYQRFLQTVDYYRYEQSISFAQFNGLSQKAKELYLSANPQEPEAQRVRFLSYSLIKNHFHFSLKPNQPKGIQNFMADLCNSYTHYFNNKYDRVGGLFQGRYKSKEIPNEQAVLQVTRYIHLNAPLSNQINKNGTLKPEDYPYSSYRYWIDPYLLETSDFILDPQEVRWGLKLLGGSEKYKEFVEAKLEGNPELGIENLTLE